MNGILCRFTTTVSLIVYKVREGSSFNINSSLIFQNDSSMYYCHVRRTRYSVYLLFGFTLFSCHFTLSSPYSHMTPPTSFYIPSRGLPLLFHRGLDSKSPTYPQTLKLSLIQLSSVRTGCLVVLVTEAFTFVSVPCYPSG